MNKRHEKIVEHIRHAAELYLAQVTRLDELTMTQLAAFAGADKATVSKVFPCPQWDALRQNWGVEHLRRIMHELYQAATTQEDFSAHRIAKRAHVSRAVMLRVIGDEWRTLQATLPTYQQHIQAKVHTTLQEMINANTPLAEMTRKRLAVLSGVTLQKSAWYTQALRAARLELLRRSSGVSAEPPPGAHVRLFSGGWVDLDAVIWDLRFAGKPILYRDRLRPDLADLAWGLLREELLQGEQALATIARHYRAFLWTGELLGQEVADARSASLEAVQRAWVRYEGTQEQRRRARTALVRLFEALFMLEDLDPAMNKAELGRIAGWLKTMVTLPAPQTEGEFLSENELNAVLTGCLMDIATGIAFTEGEQDLLSMSTRPGVSNNAAVVVQWAVALMILLMAFTGLRRESITGLRVDDWTEIRQGLFALAWRHSKKGEEHAAVLSAALADQLNVYVHRTLSLRADLGTPLVFLVGDKQAWSIIRPQRLQMRLHDFVQHHGLQRDGVTLPLSSTILRRTFTTRALYEGRSIQALRLQLGHTSLASTLRYGQFDRFEHPTEVSKPLDGYGRKVLTLWRAPLLLDDLAPNERASLLGASAQHQQDVGLCRQRSCVKAEQGSPPPCSLCEHLVTGPAFLVAWKAEYAQRARELQELEAEPTAGMLLAQMQAQFERFAANLAFVFERSRP